MKKLIKYLFVTPASILAVTPAIVTAVSCGCSLIPEDPIKDIIPQDKLVIKNGVLSGFVEGFDPTQYNTLSIPNTVHTVSANAFASTFNGTECKTKKVIIPSSVVTIETKAFYANNSIQKYDISEFSSVKSLDYASDAFGKSATSGTLIYPKDCGDTLQNSLDYLMCDAGLELGWFDTTKVRTVDRKFLKINENDKFLRGFEDNYFEVPHTALYNKLVIPYDVIRIDSNAFYQAQQSTLGGINDVQFELDPETGLTHVQVIGPEAFMKSSLKKISLKPGTTTIQTSAFEDCNKLESLELSDTLTTIEAKAFARCSSLVTLSIPSNVTTVGDNAFNGCPNINFLDLTGIYSHKNWSTSAFKWESTSCTGQIICEPSLAPQWKSYFQAMGLVFSEGHWTITDKIHIIDGYQSIVDPYIITSSENRETIETIYFGQIENNPQILIDDLYHTFYEWTKVANQKDITLTTFDAIIKSASAISQLKTVSFTMFYKIEGTYKKSGEEITFSAEGNINCINLPLSISSAKVHNPETEKDIQYLEIENNSLVENYIWLMTFAEDYTATIKNEAGEVKTETGHPCSPTAQPVRATNVADYSSMEAQKCGIFWQLNEILCHNEDNTWSWGLTSPFLKNLTPTD